MADDNGMKPPDSAEKSLGDIAGDVSQKASLLVREEIELAKAEVQTKVARLGKGAAVAAVAGVFAFFALVMFLFALAFFFNDVFVFEGLWTGFLMVMGLLLILGAIGGFVAYRFFKRGAPPTPDLAIDEAKRTRAAIEEVRS